MVASTYFHKNKDLQMWLQVVFMFVFFLTVLLVIVPKSDRHLFSPYSNTVQSDIKVVRKKKMINKWKRS